MRERNKPKAWIFFVALAVCAVIGVSILAAKLWLFVGDYPDPPSDASLESVFKRSEPEFNELIDMMTKDSSILTISSKGLSVKPGIYRQGAEAEATLPPERWERYRRIFVDLRLNNGISHPIGVDIVYLDAYSWGLVTGGVAKGYAFSTQELSPVLESLDSVTDLKGQRVVYKRLKDHWYLYWEED